jgi:hypothetical protein
MLSKASSILVKLHWQRGVSARNIYYHLSPHLADLGQTRNPQELLLPPLSFRRNGWLSLSIFIFSSSYSLPTPIPVTLQQFLFDDDHVLDISHGNHSLRLNHILQTIRS